MSKKKNRNDKLLSAEDVNNSPLLSSLNFIGFKEFKYLCKLIPNKKTESLVIKNEIPNIKELVGIVYILTIDDKVIKIGETMNTFIDRLGSYNCGKNLNRIHGTAGTTNWFILQSFLAIEKEIIVYYFNPPKPKKVNFWGRDHDCTRPIYKTAEKICIEEYIKQFNCKPCGNTQK